MPTKKRKPRTTKQKAKDRLRTMAGRKTEGYVRTAKDDRFKGTRSEKIMKKIDDEDQKSLEGIMLSDKGPNKPKHKKKKA